jgi:hypothetical protein
LKTSIWTLLALMAVGRLPGQPATIFPSDGKPPTAADGAALLQAVCPGQVEVGEKIGCGKACPDFTAFGKFGDGLPWRLARVTRGHFLSPTSDDAVLSVEGCEPHSENFGGTILLTHDSRGWVMEWYKAGVETSQCHKVRLQNDREILVCLGEYGGQGHVEIDLYVEDLLNPTGNLMAGEWHFFEMTDTMGTCGADPEDDAETFPVTRAFIEKVEFTAGTPAGIAVTASYGARPTTPDAAQACLHSRGGLAAFAPPVKSYHLDFVFDGYDYRPTPASVAEMARMFE